MFLDMLRGSYSYWYHGTDQESARSICRDGIALGLGRTNRSLSHGWGFYATDALEEAVDFAEKHHHANTSIVVFKVNNRIFNNKCGVQWSQPNWEWSQAVKFFRSGQDCFMSGVCQFYAQRLLQLDYAIGPMVESLDVVPGWQVMNWTPLPKTPLALQLCIKSEFMAQDFYMNAEQLTYVDYAFIDELL